MKKAVVAIFAMTSILLFMTNSMYIEWTEIYIIIGSISIISIIYNLSLRNNRKYVQIISSTVLIGFFLSWVFSLIDLVVDHYKVIQGVPNGRFLTLSETILESSDDLFILVIIIMCSVTLISLVGTTIYSKFCRRIT